MTRPGRAESIVVAYRTSRVATPESVVLIPELVKGASSQVGESPSVAALRELWKGVRLGSENIGLIGVFNGPAGTRRARCTSSIWRTWFVWMTSPHPGQRDVREMECLDPGVTQVDPASSYEKSLADHQRQSFTG